MTVQPRPSTANSNLILTNIETIPGKTITQHLGLVQGSSVRAKHLGRDIAAGLKNIVGGELKGYTELLQEARQEATNRMVQEAQAKGANAIVNVRFATSSLTQGAAELFVYGTAVRVE
ncbi:YbjQ family protein [Nodosilinea sp. E11]|uniref:YbjQ family protein n=1 Tax=Nodosilinea sp. E11 TaxID=3037479 RepID=UPI00293443A2|nr:YbjQ family protein [Nodosilinea sp. E11]WOD41292.1 YbjQ family protein [Nodosilinea sp. E11]